MAFLLNWWAPAKVAPPRVPTDTIIPLNEQDDNRANRNVCLEFTMHFHDILDENKLADALWKLIDRPGWRKIGARLRLNDKGKLEYHVPAQFTKERPPINYSYKSYDIPVGEHPIGRKFPKPDGTLQIFPSTEDFSKLTAPENNTNFIDDWIYTDKAQLGLHVIHFNDATLVTLTWLHTLLDAMGRHALLKAWIAVLEGREHDVPEFWGYDTNAFERLGEPVSAAATDAAAVEEFVLKDKIMSRWTMLKFIFNMVWEIFFYPNEAGRLICVPASYFARIKTQAHADLASVDPALLTMSTADAKNPTPFLSDGDVLCAWFMRLLVTANPMLLASKPSRNVLVFNVFGMRDVLRSTSPQLIPKGAAYISNCVSAIFSLFTQGELLSLPIGHVAARIRKDLTLQSTRAQVEASQRLRRENGGEAVLYGESDAVIQVFTNWLKAKLFQMDFSAAIVKEARVGGEEAKGYVRGQPAYLHVNSASSKSFPLRGSGSCMGQDHQGNFWIGTKMRKEFEEDFVRAVIAAR
ncbi:hypothetical protein IQ07DRAFT_547509 [Pyrenochaeta sp. DS3sAY3a]|nr:hypothetical protein IQ07DRAFT_547509 [Pyrenochaeta sp. DS3sAY3a]